MPEFETTVQETRQAVGAEGAAWDRLERAIELIHERHPYYEWIGVYILRDGTLELGPYFGAPTEHTRIPVGEGVCGTAVAERANQVIEDVREVENYLACSPLVRSEIVVLIWDGDEILGEIDVDCDEVGAFGPADEAFLTEVASILAPLVAEMR
jgi:L-methionine (R)-S-oxide reductase